MIKSEQDDFYKRVMSGYVWLISHFIKTYLFALALLLNLRPYVINSSQYYQREISQIFLLFGAVGRKSTGEPKPGKVKGRKTALPFWCSSIV